MSGERFLKLLCAAAVLLLASCARPPTALVNLPVEPLSADGVVPAPIVEIVTARDGQKVRGWRFDGDASKPYIVHFHGLGSSAEKCARALQPVIAAGYGLLCASYRGQNGNGGIASERTLMRDGAAFLARGRVLAAGRPLVMMGHSLGGGVLLATVADARPQDFAAVIVISSFTSLPDVSPRLKNTRDRFDNARRITRVTAPLFILHGDADALVPVAQGRALARAAPAARYTEIAGAPHRLDSGAFTATILENLAQLPALPHK